MKYSGKIGFAVQVEKAPGVWEDQITERDYVGDILQRTESFSAGASVMPQVRTVTSVSVLSDGLLKDRYDDIRYVTYMGIKWMPLSIVQAWPRIEIFFGDQYHG